MADGKGRYGDLLKTSSQSVIYAKLSATFFKLESTASLCILIVSIHSTKRFISTMKGTFIHSSFVTVVIVYRLARASLLLML